MLFLSEPVLKMGEWPETINPRGLINERDPYLAEDFSLVDLVA